MAIQQQHEEILKEVDDLTVSGNYTTQLGVQREREECRPGVLLLLGWRVGTWGLQGLGLIGKFKTQQQAFNAWEENRQGGPVVSYGRQARSSVQGRQSAPY